MTKAVAEAANSAASPRHRGGVPEQPGAQAEHHAQPGSAPAHRRLQQHEHVVRTWREREQHRSAEEGERRVQRDHRSQCRHACPACPPRYPHPSQPSYADPLPPSPCALLLPPSHARQRARLRRHPGRRRAAARKRPSHTGAAFGHRRRAYRSRAVLQVRELPAHGRVQVPWRVQRDRETGAGAATRRRDRILVGQPRAGDRARRAPSIGARHAGDAGGRAARQARRDARIRRRDLHLRSLHRRPRSARRAGSPRSAG